MTEKEAIEYLKSRYLVVGSSLNPSRECEKHNAVIDMAIKALERQIPKDSSGDVLDSLILEFGISDYLTESVRDWLEYKSERNFKYKERGLRTLLRTISEKSFLYGDTAVANAINESISSGYQGIVWDKLKKAGGDGMNWDSL